MQAMWVGCQLASTALLLYTLPGITAEPELLLVISTAVGASFASPQRLWTLPVVLASVLLTGLLFMEINWPPVVGAGAAAGFMASWTSPWRTDGLDWLNGALAGIAGTTLGTLLALAAGPSLGLPAPAALLGALLIALGASISLYPSAIRFDQAAQIPTRRTVQLTLPVQYRAPVFKAMDLYSIAIATTQDSEVHRGLAEVVTWIYRLQCSAQTLHSDLAAVDVVSVQERIDALESPTSSDDAFTRDRRYATATHLRRLLDHREKLQTELDRTYSLVDYALAFLEEARAGLALAKQLPGEAVPDRLNDVLEHLRGQAIEGDARRRTAREVEIRPSSLQVRPTPPDPTAQADRAPPQSQAS